MQFMGANRSVLIRVYDFITASGVAFVNRGKTTHVGGALPEAPV